MIQGAPPVREVPLLVAVLVQAGRNATREIEGAHLIHLVVDLLEHFRVQRVVALGEEGHRHRRVEVRVVLLRPEIVVVPEPASNGPDKTAN